MKQELGKIKKKFWTIVRHSTGEYIGDKHGIKSFRTKQEAKDYRKKRCHHQDRVVCTIIRAGEEVKLEEDKK
ncbi:MAG: hypothetical protein KAS32_05895 [Candidatus Peribacteraceae bacterium]|nr:hypothetical protein [Candidatus Peribacteraceae bacterium]